MSLPADIAADRERAASPDQIVVEMDAATRVGIVTDGMRNLESRFWVPEMKKAGAPKDAGLCLAVSCFVRT